MPSHHNAFGFVDPSVAIARNDRRRRDVRGEHVHVDVADIGCDIDGHLHGVVVNRDVDETFLPLGKGARCSDGEGGGGDEALGLHEHVRSFPPVS